MAGNVATPIMIAKVVLAVASACQLRVEPGSPGRAWPEITVKPWVSSRWVSGTPANAGPAIAEETPGITVTGMPRGRADLPLLTTAAEHEGVAALEPDDGLAPCRVLDQSLVDPLLRGGGASWDLGDLDEQRLRFRVLQCRKRSQPIADDHIGIFDRLQPCHGQQARITGTAANQDHRSGAGGLFDRGCGRGDSRHTMITSSRCDHPITPSNA